MESINLCIYGSLFCFALLFEVANACFAFTCTKLAQSGIVSLAFQRRHAAKRNDTDTYGMNGTDTMAGQN